MGKKNAAALAEYLKRMGKPVPDFIEGRLPRPKKAKRGKGRPKREDRPERSAAKRTLPGEERYLVTLRSNDIATMKQIAELDQVAIKEVYIEAITDYIKQRGFKSS